MNRTRLAMIILGFLTATLLAQDAKEAPRIPARADIDILELDEKVEAHVYLQIEPNEDGSIYQIGDWGKPKQEGKTIYLNATSEGPLESFNTEPVKSFHPYCLLDDEDDHEFELEPDDLSTIRFRDLELIPEWLHPKEAQNLVFRTEEEWSAWVGKNWPPHIRAAAPEMPVNFDKELVIAVLSGEADQGFNIQIEHIETNGEKASVNYTVAIPGILPESADRVRTGHMVAIEQTKLPMDFGELIIALPGVGSEPIPVDPFPVEYTGLPPFAAGEGQLTIAAKEEGNLYTIIFTIDGEAYSKVAYHREDIVIDEPLPRPMEAKLAVQQEGDSYIAHASVAINGRPYQTISDWGAPVLEGNTFVIDARSQEIVFIREPDLPIIDSKDYLLPLGNSTEPIPTPLPELSPPIAIGDDESLDFTRVEPVRGVERQQNVVINNKDEWWSLTGFEPGPLVLPAPNPVDFDAHTVIGTFAGAKPNGCYGINIHEVVQHQGHVLVYYTSREPGPEELCSQAITYPASLVAIEKTALPIDFIKHKASDAPIIIESEPGNGDDGSTGARGPVYNVLFRVNGQGIARTTFRIHGVALPPHEEEEPPLNEVIRGRLHAEVKDSNSASVHLLVDVSGAKVPLKVFRWGEVEQDGTTLVTDLFIGEAGAEEGSPFVEEHTYELSNLTKDYYNFIVFVNGNELTATKFIVNHDGDVGIDLSIPANGGPGKEGGGPPPSEERPSNSEIVSDAFTSWLDRFIPEDDNPQTGEAVLPDANRFAKANNFDGDAWSNFDEFLLGINPANPRELPFIRPEWVEDGQGRGHLGLCFKRHKEAPKFADFVIEASENLSKWIDDPSLVEQISAEELNADLEEVTVSLRDLAETSPYRYLRLRLRQKSK